MYRAAALTGLLAADNNRDWDYDAVETAACTIGDMMESRAKAEDAKRYANIPRMAQSKCLTCRYDHGDPFGETCVNCRGYDNWQPKEASDALPTG